MAHEPSLKQIGFAQNLDENLRRQLAARRCYGRAKKLHFGGASVAVAFSLAAPVALFWAPEAGPTLGAVAGAWIFVSRLLLEPLKEECQLKAARAQELFDTTVLGIAWNESLTTRLSEEEVRKAGGELTESDLLRDWYPTREAAGWPLSVLICQRANAVWSRRQNATYGRGLLLAAGGWAILGAAVAVGDAASLSTYLTTIALPSLPALLDAVEMLKKHRLVAAQRQIIEERTDSLIRSGDADAEALRDSQDRIFTLRRDGPMVPDWFYNLIRTDYETDMQYAAAQIARRSLSSRMRHVVRGISEQALCRSAC